MKICPKCKKPLPATIEFFGVRNDIKSGLRSHCKTCRSENAREQRKNPEFLEKEKQQGHKYYKNNKAKITAAKKKYYENNKEKINQRNRRYYKNNLEKEKQRKHEYRKNNKEKIKLQSHEYYKNNPEKIAANNIKRRALKLNQTPDLTQEEKQQIIDIYKHSVKLGPGWQVDHIQPISKGGLHHPDNLQIVAKSYNLQKGSKSNFRLPFEWEIYNKCPQSGH
jgi:hypothetical protein